ncbi:MAG: hypothetical protein QM775_16830 [Pirellulales bacterium]
MAGGRIIGAGSTLNLTATGSLTATNTNFINTNLALNTVGGAAITRTFALTGINDSLTINGVISDASPTAIANITTSGAGTLILMNTNTYRGTTTIATGTTLVINSAGNLGSGTLSMTGTATLIPNAAGITLTNAVTTAAGFTVGGTNAVAFGNTTTLTGASTITLNNSGGVTFGAINATNQNLTFTGPGDVTLGGATTIGTGTLTKINAGTLTTGANNVLPSSGTLVVNGGTYNQGNTVQTVNSLAVGRAAIAALNLSGNAVLNITGSGAGGLFLGDSGANASGTLNISGNATLNVGGGNGIVLANGAGVTNVNESGTINLNGGVLSTRKISMINAGGSFGYLNFNGGTLRAAASSTSFVSGLTAAVLQTGGGTIDSNGFTITFGQQLSGAGGLTVVDSSNSGGVVTLSANNVYTGSTNVASGTLALGGNGSLAGTAINVATGATLAVVSNYTIGSFGSPTLTIDSGGTLSLANSFAQTLTLNSATAGATVLTMGSGSGTFLNFDIGGSADQIAIGNGLLVRILGGGVVLNPSLAGALANGTYTLISAPGGGLLSTNGTSGLFSLGSSVIGGANLTLNITDTLLSLTIANAPPPPAIAYFRGTTSVWNSFTGGSLNWATDSTGGTPTDALPGSVTDVHFYAATALPASLTTTLGQDFTIRSLTHDGGSTRVTIDGTIEGSAALNTLTITPVDSSTGITVNAGAGGLTINAPLVVGADQTWTNNASTVMTIAGPITGVGNLTVKANTAAVTINGMLGINGTYVNSGLLVTTLNGGVGSGVRSLTNNGAATLTINGAPLTVNTNGTTLTNNGTTTFTVAGGVNGTGNLIVRANSSVRSRSAAAL